MSGRLAVISFDAVSTLIKPGGGGVGRQYADAAEKLINARFNAGDLQSSFFRAFKSQRASYPNYGYKQNMSERRWWTDVVVDAFKGASVSCHHSDEEYERVASHLFDNFEWDLYPNVQPLLHHIKCSKGLKLCVVSNSDERLHAALEKKELLGYFDLVLTSRGVGVEKPNALIFKRVLEHFRDDDGASMPSERVLHVGDDVVCDYEAAKSIGMKSILVDHRRTMLKSDWICHDLSELSRKIDRLIDD